MFPASMQLKAFFPRDGSTETPPHPSADFRWKDYCPMAFGRLREVFNIEAAAYMQSICGEPSLPRCMHPHQDHGNAHAGHACASRAMCTCWSS